MCDVGNSRIRELGSVLFGFVVFWIAAVTVRAIDAVQSYRPDRFNE